MANNEADVGIWTSPTPGETDKVDEVLAAKNAERAAEGFVPDSSQQIEALRAEIDRLQDSIREIASGSKRLATTEFDELKAAAEEKLRENVFLSVGIAALVGYLWGRARR